MIFTGKRYAKWFSLRNWQRKFCWTELYSFPSLNCRAIYGAPLLAINHAKVEFICLTFTCYDKSTDSAKLFGRWTPGDNYYFVFRDILYRQRRSYWPGTCVNVLIRFYYIYGSSTRVAISHLLFHVRSINHGTFYHIVKTLLDGNSKGHYRNELKSRSNRGIADFIGFVCKV